MSLQTPDTLLAGVIFQPEVPEYTIPEGPPPQIFCIPIVVIGMIGPGRECNVTVHTTDIPGDAIGR